MKAVTCIAAAAAIVAALTGYIAARQRMSPWERYARRTTALLNMPEAVCAGGYTGLLVRLGVVDRVINSAQVVVRFVGGQCTRLYELVDVTPRDQMMLAAWTISKNLVIVTESKDSAEIHGEDGIVLVRHGMPTASIHS